MRSDCASSPTRGSRFVGLLSMITTRVLGSSLLEQEEAKSARPTIASSHRRLGIGDLSQYGGATGSGGRRHVRRAAIDGLIGQKRECRCFFRARRQSEFIGVTKAQAQGSQL